MNYLSVWKKKREDLFMKLKNKEEELKLVFVDLENAFYKNEILKAVNNKLK